MTMALTNLDTGDVMESDYAEEINRSWVETLENRGYRIINHDLSGSSWHYHNGRNKGLILEIA